VISARRQVRETESTSKQKGMDRMITIMEEKEQEKRERPRGQRLRRDSGY
jgi:hypothetical protein